MRQDARRARRRRGKTAAGVALAAGVVGVSVLPPAVAQDGLDQAAAAQEADVAEAATLRLEAPRASVWEAAGGVRYVLLRGLPVRADAAAVGAGGGARLGVGRRSFDARRALVELTPEPGLAGGYAMRAALEGARGTSGGGGSLRSATPLRVTGRVGPEVDLMTPGLERGRPDAAIGPLLAALRGAGEAPAVSEEDAPVTAAERQRGEERAAEVAATQARLLAPPTPEEDIAAGRLAAEARREAEAEAGREPENAGVLPAAGVVSLDAPRYTVEPLADGGSALTMQGGVKLQYEDLSAPGGRVVTLSAERAVVFLAGEDAEAPASKRAALDASGVSGVYLEDAVEVSDGDLAVRGSRVFYDVAGNRAVLLDAVLYRVDPGDETPLYVRAEVLRQTARQSFAAEQATLTTTSFAEPAVALGVDRVDVRGYETRGGRQGLAVDARGLTLEAGGVPVFWFPRVAGRGSTIPLRSVAAGYSENQGVRFRTVWDAYSLLGLDPPPGVDASFTLGVRGEHGVEIGGDVTRQTAEASTSLRGYALPDDQGEDNLPRRPDLQNDGVFRGHVGLTHRQALPNATTLTLEAQSSSDPTYYEAFFRNLAYSAPADEASAYLQHRDGDTSASLLVSTRIDPFIGQLVPLETFGYTVDRLPEAQLRQVGRSLAGGGDADGGSGSQLLWFQETTAGLLRANTDDSTPGERGFVGGLGRSVFGVASGSSFDDALDARGVPGDAVARFDSRQELQAPVRLGPVIAAPFAVGRVTAYDQDFDAFAGGGNDPVRAWGQAGVRLSATGARTLSDGRSGLLDVDGIRHVVEPHATLAYAWTNVSAEQLPVYDPLVEDLAEGGQAALGVRQTLQTRRGPRRSDTDGAPSWEGARTVDWVIVDTTFVLQEEERRGVPGLRQLLRGDASPALIGRYDDQRPETARGGDFFQTDARWLVTDSFGLAGELIQDLDGGGVPLWRIGGQLQHTPRFSLRAGYTRLKPLDSELLKYGFRYRITDKYAVEVEHTIDLGGSERRTIDVDVERRLPQFSLRASARFDELRDDTTIGFALVPRRTR